MRPNTPLHLTCATSSFSRRLTALLALGFIIHFCFGFLLGFSVDEAHYALYASKLAWSYFDHPPLVGWVQWPLVAPDFPIGIIRIIPETLWLIACLQAMQLARDPRLHIVLRRKSLPEKRELTASQTETTNNLLDNAGLWAVGLCLLAPVMHVLAVGLLPDTLLMVLTMGIFQLTLKLCDPCGPPQIKYWFYLGVMLGLAGLSKYTAIFPAAAVTIILLRRFGLSLLLNKGIWLSVLVAGILVSPVFYWNAQHDWISFNYQINHGTGGDWEFKKLVVFLVIQFAAFGPLLVGAICVYLGLIIKQSQASQQVWLLFFLIPFGVTVMLAGKGGLPHWTAPAWLAATPFAARLIASDWVSGRKKSIQIWTGVQILICLAAFSLLFFTGLPGASYLDPLGKKNPFADLAGWDEAGKTAQKLSVKLQAPALAVNNWTLASRLAWYARPLPVHVLDNRFDQFDLWFGSLAPTGDAIFVNWSQMSYELPIGPQQFQTCEPIESIEILRFGRAISAFSFYHCKNWGNKP